MKTINFIKIFSICSLLVLGTFTAHAQTMQLGAVTASPGSVVTVPLNLSGFSGLLGSISLKIQYDGNILSFQTATNVTGNTALNPSISGVGTNPVGISWLDFMGQSFPTGQWLAIQFNFTDCYSDLTFDLSQCYVTDELGLPITVTYINGSVTSSQSSPLASDWTGVQDQQWTNAGNWSNGVPVCATDVVIPNVTNYPIISASKANVAVNSLTLNEGARLTVLGALVVANDLTVESDASIIENGNLDVYGQTFVERACTGGTNVYHMVSNPLTYAQAITFLGHFLREWDEDTQMWVNVTAPSTPLTSGKGYALNAVSSETFVFDNGALKFGNVAKTGLTYTTAGVPDPLLAGFHLLGNPYPSSLNYGPSWTRNKVDNFVWVWSGANYLVGNGAATGTLPGDIIPPMNGFFVRANAGGSPLASITIPQAARVHGMVPFYKSKSEGRLAFKVSGNSFEDNMVVFVDNQSTVSVDSVDAFKLYGFEEAPQLYTVVDDIPLTLNHFPEAGYVSIYLEVGADGVYTISSEGMETFAANVTLTLEDLKEGTLVDLKETNTYEFTALTNDNPERFMLHFGTVGIEDMEAENISIYSYNDAVKVLLPENITNGTAFIYNVMGQQVVSQELVSGNNTIKVEGGLNYIVKVVTDTAVKSDKVFVK